VDHLPHLVVVAARLVGDEVGGVVLSADIQCVDSEINVTSV
jgi:hypothetical protein